MLYLGDHNDLHTISRDRGDYIEIKLVIEIRRHIKAKAVSSGEKEEGNCKLFTFSLLVIDMILNEEVHL